MGFAPTYLVVRHKTDMKKIALLIVIVLIFFTVLFQIRVIGYGYKVLLSKDGNRQKIEVWDGRIPDQKISIYISNPKDPILISGTADNLADPIETEWFRVTFKDETIKPGRVKIRLHGRDMDFMEHTVSIDGVNFKWKSTVEL